MGTVSAEFALNNKQMIHYANLRKKFLSVLSSGMLNINTDLAYILNLIESKLLANSKDTTSVKLPAIESSTTGESSVTSAACLTSAILHEFEKVSNPAPSGSVVGEHFCDTQSENTVREHILAYLDRLSFEAARWQGGSFTPIKPVQQFSADDPFVATILNYLDSFLQGLANKSKTGTGQADLASWRSNTKDPGADLPRIGAYTSEIRTLLTNDF